MSTVAKHWPYSPNKEHDVFNHLMVINRINAQTSDNNEMYGKHIRKKVN